MKRPIEWSAGIRRSPTIRNWPIFYVVFPFVVLILYLCILYFSLPKNLFWTFGALSLAYFIPPAGKETIVPLMVISGLPWWLAAISIMLFDLMGALFIIWNFPLALKIPWFGPWAKRLMVTGREQFDQSPLIEHLSIMGLALFVMIPFDGSGGVAAAIIGRILGMNYQKVFVSVFVGSLISASTIALSAEYIISLVESGVISGIVGLGIAILIVIVVLIGVSIWANQKKENSSVPENETDMK